ncbi:ABC transporter substrate-binding protein [Streptomyces boninensis]|uniref:ABC transporter substrate-binding protein n=1 Tax=Streptomyces boninensis TaxID=2039455 RepID=UPI003B215F94
MIKRLPRLAAPAGATLAIALLATGCGSDSGAAAGSGDKVVMGMTDEITAIDPASGYDVGSWLVFNNVFQSLLSFPSGGTEPRPEAAKSCNFEGSGSKVFTCKLRDGLKFSNGNELTSKDVKYSFDRTLRIQDEGGPAVAMLASIGKVETPDKKTVTFKLKYADATFPMKIASGAGSIVDHTEYPADKLRKDGKAVGSGVYKLDKYGKSEAVFSVNPDYKGTAEVRNSGMTLKLFHNDTGKLKSALESGDLDLAYRGLAMKDIADLQAKQLGGDGDQKINVVEGTGAEVQHLVFNMDDPVGGDPAVRKAMAYLIDRSALVRDVYERTAEPLYSIVPAGVAGHNTAFYDTYGGRPDVAKAKQALRAGGREGKVKVTLYAPPERFGPGTVPSFKLIAKQLNASGLFDADMKTVPLAQWDKSVKDGKFGVYVRGWVPDYPDPDNFTSPFFGKDNVLGNNYDPGEITGSLIPQTAAQPDRGSTVGDFGKVQDKVAADLPVIPLWQGKQYAVAKENILGLENTIDASTVFRFWEIEKGEDDE